MRISITARLIAAFLLVSVTGLALASVIANWLTVREFKQLSMEQARNRFVADATAYYDANGKWDGLTEAYFLRRGPPPPNDSGPRTIATSDATQSLSVTAASMVPPVPNRSPRGLYFILMDSIGKVIVPAGDYKQGDIVPTNAMTDSVPVNVNNMQVGRVLAIGSAPPLNPFEEAFLRRINRALFYAALGAAGFALLLGVILARNLTQPLRALTMAIRAVATGNLKQRVTVTSHDELGTLASAFNQMSEDLDALMQSRRQMTADIAHDLRTPLTVIGGYVESMRDGVLKPTTERLNLIHSEVLHLQRLVEDLRTLSQADAGELSLNRESTPIVDLLARVAQSYRPLADKQSITIKTEFRENLPPVFADPDRLTQVLSNLVTNALRYSPEGGEIIFRAWQEPQQERQSLWIAVQDNGAGIAPEALPHIFDRFYRADSARSNGSESGLGLAIAKSIIEAHGGSIRASSQPSKGTQIQICLPLNKPS